MMQSRPRRLPVYPGAYQQGLAYLQLHDATQAANAFRITTQSPGGNWANAAPFYAQAHWVWRGPMPWAVTRRPRRKPIRTSLPPGRTQWNLPMLLAAKKEYDAL